MAKENRYSEGKVCRHCGKPVPNKNRLGSCAHCRMTIDQRGAGNHMYGKKLTDEQKSQCAESTRKLWTDPEYRKKVVENATGLHRGDDFRRGQSERTKASYDKIKGLRELRGDVFSQCWKDGRNHFRVRKNKKSKEEREIFEYLKDLGKYVISDDEVCLDDNKFLAPDMVINGKVIVEFYGDYFHANPALYKAEEYIVKKEQTARQLWDADLERQKMLEDAGYSVIIIWQNDFRHDKQATLTSLVKEIDLRLKGENK